MNKLTPKQEGFCQSYIETGNASEAYRQNYNVHRMNANTINRKAKELIDNGKITARINSLQVDHAKRHNMTIDSLTDELNEAIRIAREDVKPSAMIVAIMAKAKLHGLLTDRIESVDDSIANRLALRRKARQLDRQND
jgi:transcription antitermination factor NusA-like protein